MFQRLIFFMKGVSLARPSKDDFDCIYSFFSVLDALYASPWSFSDEWVSWDDDDPDKQELLRLRRMLAVEECCDEADVDSRLVFEAFVRSRISGMCGAWGRVVPVFYKSCSRCGKKLSRVSRYWGDSVV